MGRMYLPAYLTVFEADPSPQVTEVKTNGIIAPRAHQSSLLTKVVSRAFAPFIAMAVEHLGVGTCCWIQQAFKNRD